MTGSNSPPDPNSDYLPDNLPECHAVIADLRHEVQRLLLIADMVTLLQQRVADLEKQVRRNKRKIFGQSSAQVPAESLTGTGKAVYDAYKDELDAERARLQLVPDKKFHGGGGRNIPTDGVIERPVEHTITDPAVLACPCCGEQRQVIGFTVSSQLDILKTVFELLNHKEYKYACPNCEGQVISASKPYQPIDKGLPAPGLIAHIAVAKFDWHLPLYRQERIYLAQGVPIARSSMSRWLCEGAELLRVIVDLMHERMLSSRLVQSDATTMPVIVKGLGKVHKGHSWIYRDERDIIYDFTEAHNGDQPERMLAGFEGVLLTDGAPVFNGVIEGGATRAGCAAHAFRYLEDARKEDPEQVDLALAIMKSLFDVEQLGAQLPEQERRDLRERYAIPRLAALRAWIDEQTPLALPKSALGEALTYLNNQWQALCYYAGTGFVPSHNNASENGIRPLVLGRGNWLFAGSVAAARAAAVWMSLIQTCRLHGIDPFEYLKDVLTRLPSTPTSHIDQFLPDVWKSMRETTQM
jgi:transposase